MILREWPSWLLIFHLVHFNSVLPPSTKRCTVLESLGYNKAISLIIPWKPTNVANPLEGVSLGLSLFSCYWIGSASSSLLATSQYALLLSLLIYHSTLLPANNTHSLQKLFSTPTHLAAPSMPHLLSSLLSSHCSLYSLIWVLYLYSVQVPLFLSLDSHYQFCILLPFISLLTNFSNYLYS